MTDWPERVRADVAAFAGIDEVEDGSIADAALALVDLAVVMRALESSCSNPDDQSCVYEAREAVLAAWATVETRMSK